MSRDVFAAIAGRGAAADRTEDLAPTPPFVPLPPGVPVWDDAALGVEDWKDLPRIADESALAAELARLRAWARPFLERHAPADEPARPALALAEFDWKLVPPDAEGGFVGALEGGGEGWTRVTLPHYGGPTGRALAWYWAGIEIPADFFAAGRTVWLCFGGADYRARVTVNGRCVGEHEGFFAPFEFDVTRAARPGKNRVFVELWNDGICMGYQDEPDGDKIYAATGPGWDEPGSGWHHCPPGMGLWRPARIESRPAVFVRDLWVRPLPGLESAEVRAEVHNALDKPVPVELQLGICGENFPGAAPDASGAPVLPPAGPGTTLYRRVVAMPGARQWSPDAPWLYRAQARLSAEGLPGDAASCTFGMREFRVDEDTAPKGRLFLNGEPVRLRGANTMGFEQQRVMAGDLAGLADDILLAKACHMNFLRFTQRPVEREVYDLCDRLGIMAQSDLPLFGYLRRTQFCEAVRQSAEMARHTRRHASNILLTFINEPFGISSGDKTHRQLDRAELEGFFAAAACAIRVEDPDVAIKPVDGDYDPPAAFGLPDAHVYALWYNGHGLAFGQLHQGAFPPTKRGWCFGCGEYGAEGLDSPDLMHRRYPADWLPQPGEPASAWTPARICRAQSAQMQPLFFDRPGTLEEWCAASREHQRRATKELTEAFRRMDRMVSCAIHLFIDAWPAGWMKTVADCERRPKPAFFALRDAFAPLIVTPRSDRFFYFAGETAGSDIWVCNDGPAPIPGCRVLWRVETPDGQLVAGGGGPANVPACAPFCAGIARWTMPRVESRTRLTLRAALLSPAGDVLAGGSTTFELFPEPPAWDQPKIVLLDDGDDTPAARLAAELALDARRDKIPSAQDPVALASAWPEDAALAQEWTRWAEAGGTLVLYDLEPCALPLPGGSVEIKRSGFWSALFASRATGHPMVADFEPDDFRYWFDARAGRIEPFLPTAILAPETWRGILATGSCQWGEPSVPAHAACEQAVGAGRVVLCQLQLEGRTKANPPALKFARRILQP